MNYCYKLADKSLTDTEVNIKKKQVYSYMLKNVVNERNFSKITSAIVKKTFKIIDKVYFNNAISEHIEYTNSKLDFGVSGKLTSTAGRCDYKVFFNNDEFDYGEFSITISKPIINNIFSDKKVKSLKINGIHCFDKLECYISLYEHELIHLLIALFCYNDGKCSGGHTPMFKKITYNLFRHTEYKHLLLSGDSIQLEKDQKHNKLNIEIGDYITTKECKGKIYEGEVFKITSKYAYITRKDGKKYGYGFEFIDKIKKNKGNKILKINKLSPDEIKKNLKIGSKIKVKIKGKIHDGDVLSINASRTSILLDDGKKWYIPYSMIIL